MYAVEVKNLNKYFGKYKALDRININIKKNTIHGIIGENGAGKTTLLQMMAGVYSVEEGEILVLGDSVYENNKVKEKIGYVADRNQYFKDYRVDELVTFYRGIYSNFSMEDFHKYNYIFNLPLNKKIRQLSKGQQMRLTIMLTLSINPEVLILDEPTSGLDAMAKKDLLDILIDQVEREKMTIVISSHHISELEKICDEFTIISEGRVKYQSNIEDIKKTVKKLQVVSKKNIDKDLELMQGVLSFEKLGSVYYMITDSYGDDLVKELEDLGVDLIQEIGISLEEIFINVSGKRGEIYE